VHGELHLLTLVFGASLIGEAIDYSIQYFGAYAGAGRDWEAERGMRMVRPGLTLRCSPACWATARSCSCRSPA